MNKNKKTERAKKGPFVRGPVQYPNSRKKVQRRNFLQDVPGFRWLKGKMMGKSQSESLDLLDQWILKKPLSLFW